MRVELYGVPVAEKIQIHNGNKPKHVVGCFAAGTTASHNFVGNSRKAMTLIEDIINADGTDNITVIVNEIP